MSFDSLYFFVRIVDSGSITKAAQELGTAKANLSRKLANLEKQMGGQLLQRSTRKLTLTANGRALYEQLQPLYQQLLEVQQQAFVQPASLSGPLRVRFPLELFSQDISEIVAEFNARYPNIELQISHYSGEVSNDLTCDLVFVLHEQDLPDLDWVARGVMSIPQVVVCSANCANVIADLDRARVIAARGEQTWWFRRENALIAKDIQPAMSIDSPSMRMTMALRGRGVAKVPQYMVQEAVRKQQLRVLNLDGQPVALQLSVLFKNQWQNAKAQAFLSHFQEQIGRLYTLLT